MEEKNKFWKGVMTGVLVTAFACLVTVGTSLGIYMFGRRAIDNQVQIQAEQSDSAATGPASETADSPLDLERIGKKIRQLENLVDQTYLFDEKRDVAQEETGIYNGFLYGLNDPYAAYYTAEELASFMDDTKGSYSGIGAMVSQDRSTGISTIIRVYKDTPAERAGILPGDIIFAVDGEEVTGIDLTLLVNNYVKGEDGTDVKLTMFRESANEYKEFTVTREKLDVQTVSSEMLNDGIGYIAVTEFDSITTEQFKNGIDTLTGQGMKKMIVDLRSNPGGDLETVTAMLDYILADGKTMVTVSDKYEEKDIRTSGDGHELNIPIVVLVNENSASASEVFTGALKDYDMATVVGMTTYGKGIVQTLIPLSDGSAVKLTTAHYYTPNGTDIHGKGITPDVEVQLDKEAALMAVVPKEQDNQLQEAIKVLEGK